MANKRSFAAVDDATSANHSSTSNPERLSSTRRSTRLQGTASRYGADKLFAPKKRLRFEVSPEPAGINAQRESRLLQLPLKVRNSIYSFALAKLPIDVEDLQLGIATLDTDNFQFKFSDIAEPGLLATCWQIWREALDMQTLQQQVRASSRTHSRRRVFSS